MAEEKKLYGLDNELLTPKLIEQYCDVEGEVIPPLYVVVWEKGTRDLVRFKTEPIYSMKEGAELMRDLKKHTDLDVTVEPIHSAIDLTIPKLELSDEEKVHLKLINATLDADSELKQSMIKVLDYLQKISPININSNLFTWRFKEGEKDYAIIERAKHNSKELFQTVDEIVKLLRKSNIKTITFDI